jgi:hypothetical protein
VQPEVRKAIPVHKEQPAVVYVPVIIDAAADDDDDHDVETGMERYYESRMFAPQYEQGDQHPSSYQPVKSLYARERDSEPSNFAPYHPTGGHFYSDGNGGGMYWGNDGTHQTYFSDGNGGYLVWWGFPALFTVIVI